MLESDQDPRPTGTGVSISIVAYMTTWCPDCLDAQKVLKRSGLAYTMIDVEAVASAEKEMIEAAGGVRKVPTIIIEAGDSRRVLIEPADADLKDALKEAKSLLLAS